MTKQDTAMPDRPNVRPQSESALVPELHGQATRDGSAANSTPHNAHDPDRKVSRAERLVSKAFSLGDNDLARDNLENDLPDADLQDL